VLTQSQRTQILRFDTCKIANALERLHLRLKNEGFTRPGLHCVTGGFPAALGYAVTCRVRTADPPIKGSLHLDMTEWWDWIAKRTKPCIAVIEDVDHKPGQGAVLGDVHAEILRALDCQAVVTNGSVRNLPGLVDIEFPVFSQFIAASHSYLHMLDFGGPVIILDLQIQTGDLLYVDVHGALLLPQEPAGAIDDLIRVAHEQSVHERTIIDLCRSPQFSLDKLRAEILTMRDPS
jgi:regulator of RNase E activity RraA